MKKLLVLIFLTLFALTACASLSKGQCQSGDWYGIGLADGARGAALTKLSQHRNACAELGININGDEYRNGRAEGLKTYCRPLNGYQQGRNGYTYNNVCPDNLNADFYQAHQYGYKIYNLEQDIAAIQARVKVEEAATLDETLSKSDRKDHLEMLSTANHDLDAAFAELDTLMRQNRWELP